MTKVPLKNEIIKLNVNSFPYDLIQMLVMNI
jgi:hypothetical protein